MDVPHVKREDYQLTDISDDGYLTLMADNGDLREDLKIPDGDLGTQLRSDFDSGKELLVSTATSFLYDNDLPIPERHYSPDEFTTIDNFRHLKLIDIVQGLWNRSYTD